MFTEQEHLRPMDSSESSRAIDRATVVQTITGLIPSDLARVVTFIEGAAIHISRHGTVPEQAAELISWVESSAGPGLEVIQKALDQLTPDPLEQAQNTSGGRRPLARPEVPKPRPTWRARTSAAVVLVTVIGVVTFGFELPHRFRDLASQRNKENGDRRPVAAPGGTSHAIMGPAAHLSVKELDSGLATLQFRFTDPPTDFVLSTIVLHLKQLGPEIDLVGQPSKRIEVAKYTERVPSSILDDPDPRVAVEADLMRDSNEPYARADITLWYDRRDRAVRLSIIPQYLDEHGNPIGMTTTPDHVEVTLRNSRLVLPERASSRKGE
jgi:hypothetical protein